MILYFNDSHGKMRKVAEIDESKSHKEISDEITLQIKRFCDERKYKIPYTRIWDEDYKGKMLTKFDVGSHSEFFYTDPPSYELFVEERERQRKESGYEPVNQHH